MSRLKYLLANQRLTAAEQTVRRCTRCGAWCIGSRPCGTPFCHTTPDTGVTR